MARSALGSLALGYHPLWNRARQLAGILLYARDGVTSPAAQDDATPHPAGTGAHLLRREVAPFVKTDREDF